ncbi:sensor histidine kinase [Streptomyces griseosporeus]|uniref:sensor histidine kinase n=1 Tax=Streptomyces griseosporeus TaxID=1910 RepID=UPI0036868AF3
MNGVGERLAREARVLWGELWAAGRAPLPPSVWLRWLPHGLVCLVAFGVVIANGDQVGQGYRQGAEYALLCSLALGAGMVLALWWPVQGWWLSTAVNVVTALGARSQLIAGQAEPNSPWPWTPPGIVAESMALLLLALRMPTRVSAKILGLTALVTGAVQGWLGGSNYSATGTFAVALFAGVVLLGTALRGRREARTQLVEQAGITAEERARRALLEERSRIARELHDVVAHHMSVISIQAQVAPHLVENPSQELKENLAGIRNNALEALTELRRVLGVLRSEHPEDASGVAAPGTGPAPDAPQPTLDRLGALLDNARSAGLTIATEIRGERRPYPQAVELSAYRIVQEALSNAIRHAPGSAVKVEVAHLPDGLFLGVTNSRPARPAAPSPGVGHGLLGMRERAAMLGGHVTAVPSLHGGFMVTAFLPQDGRRPAPATRPAPDNLPPTADLVFPTAPISPTAPDSPTAPNSPTGEETP